MNRNEATCYVCGFYVLINAGAGILYQDGIIHPPFSTLMFFSIGLPLVTIVTAVAFYFLTDRKYGLVPLIAPIVTACLAAIATIKELAAAANAV